MTLSDLMVLRQSHNVYEELGRDAVGFIVAVEQKLQTIEYPDVLWRHESLDTGLLKALAGKRRDVLLVEHRRLREYCVLVGARPLGTALQTSWLLAARARLANDLRRAVRVGDPDRFAVGSELDLLDNIELAGFADLTRLAVKHAVKLLAETDEDLTGDDVGLSLIE